MPDIGSLVLRQPPRSWPKRTLPPRIALMTLLIFVALWPATARTAPAPLNVLFLSSYQEDVRGTSKFKEGVLSTFAANESLSINIFCEYLDTIRFSIEENEQSLAEFYRSRYRDKKIDVIISHASPALDFLLKYKDTLFHGAPVVFALLADPNAQKQTLPPDYVGITAGPDFASTLDVAMTLLPDTENVLVVGGTSPVDRQYLATARDQLTSFGNRVKISYLNQISMDDMLTHVATLPERTVILYSLIQKDGTGKLFPPHEAAAHIADAANAPVFALSETNMNTGLVGGRVMSLNMIGRASAATALDIIQNKNFMTTAPHSQPTHTDIFDWEALQRWHLDEKRLPAGSIVLNRKLTFWQQYREQLLAVAVLIFIETVLLVLLLVNRTTRIRAETVLRDSETRNRQILQTATDGYLMTDREGRVLEVNEAYCRMSGYTSLELLSMGIRDLDPFMTAADIEARMRDTIEAQGARFESHHRRKDGSIFDVEISKQVLEESGNQQFFSFVRDMTQQKQMEEQLRQAQKLESIGNLAAGIAHDFNNILSPIIGLSELLMEDLPAGSFEREHAVGIRSSAMRAADLVKQILTFSRRGKTRRIPIRVQQILRDVYKLMRTTIPSNIPLHEEVRKECRPVLADPTQLHQIGMNLITNAYHAVEETGGEITLGLRETMVEENDPTLPPGAYAVLSVSDTGKGVPAEVLDRIFEPYFSTKAHGKGTGLGLSTVYGIVKEYGGDIRVANNPGPGVRFDVYLPVIQEDAPLREGVADASLPTGHEHILLVDDEPAITNTAAKSLRRLGYQVTPFNSPMAAREAFALTPTGYDLVISDMAMPQMTGVQLAEALLAIRPDIPILLCTGFSEKIDPEKAKALGIRGVLMKPVERSELALMVRRVLATSPVLNDGK